MFWMSPFLAQCSLLMNDQITAERSKNKVKSPLYNREEIGTRCPKMLEPSGLGR